MRTWAFAVLCVMLASAGEARAQGEGERAIAIASIEMAGDATPELRAHVGNAIADGLAKSGSRVVKLEAAVAAAKGDRELATCVTPDCLQRLTAALGVRQLVRAHVSVSGDSYEIDLELLSPTADGGLAGRLQRSCAVCTVGELGELLIAAADDLANGRTAQEPAADLRVPPEQGADGVDLTASAPDQEERPFRTWKWVAAGGAAAAVLTGVALLLADGSGTCDAGDGAQCPEVYDTRAAGLVGVSLGILGGGASAWMFVADR